MIINLHGKVNNDQTLQFDLTPVYFEKNCNVAITQLWMEFSKRETEIYGYISSSLVDKSPINPRQQLLFFSNREKSRILHYTPTHLEDYKIQCQSLHSSVFELHCYDTELKTPKINNIYIQLKVTNAGV